MSWEGLQNYLALQDPSSGFAKTVSADANGTVLERLQYLVDNLPAGEPMPPAVSVISGLAIGFEIGAAGLGAIASQTFVSANLAIYVPFRVTKSATAYRMFCVNGATASGNLNMAIYNSAWANQVETGSTAQSGTSTYQDVEIADTVLAPGLYYMALSLDNTMGTFDHAQSFSRLNRAWGIAQEAAAFAMPATATPAAPTTVIDIPLFGVSFRSTL